MLRVGKGSEAKTQSETANKRLSQWINISAPQAMGMRA
jgi:hypothetical protein